MKKKVDVFDYAGHICKALKKGILLTSAAGEQINTMTIGWGKLGIEWNRPVFIAYVRESRYTKQLLEKNREFTVNISFGDHDPRVLSYCGTKSGRDTDKIRDMGLNLIASDIISVPGIQEFPLTLECRVMYQQKQNVHALPDAVIERFYPNEGDANCPDSHIAYYGEIVNAWLFEA